MQPTIDEIRTWIDEAERIVVLTGAGISTDSGIPDYRGPQGTWTKNPKAERMANIEYYLNDPEVRKQSWRHRLTSPIWDAKPNDGHLALLELERRGQLHALITQNVDGLHLLAGHDPALVIEMHGNARGVMCWDCGERAPMERALARVRAGEDDPACRACGGILKSTTVSFGQNLEVDDIMRSEQAALTCDLLLAVGSTLTVYPAAGVVPIAKQQGARVVIINQGETQYDAIADAVLEGAISELLPRLITPAP